MSKEITYHWGEDQLTIHLGKRLDPRLRAIFWAEAIFTSTLAIVFIMRAFKGGEIWLRWVTGIGGVALCMIAVLRFLSRMAYREHLILDSKHFTIIQKSFLSTQVERYLWTEMGPLHYIGKPPKTDHPLKGQSFDMGFDSNEHIIQCLHPEGNLYFKYNRYPVRFGRNVYSWDAEEMVRMMQLYAGDKMRLGAEWKMLMQEQE